MMAFFMFVPIWAAGPVRGVAIPISNVLGVAGF